MIVAAVIFAGLAVFVAGVNVGMRYRRHQLERQMRVMKEAAHQAEQAAAEAHRLAEQARAVMSVARA